jgi:hypothetical protein
MTLPLSAVTDNYTSARTFWSIPSQRYRALRLLTLDQLFQSAMLQKPSMNLRATKSVPWAIDVHLAPATQLCVPCPARHALECAAFQPDNVQAHTSWVTRSAPRGLGVAIHKLARARHLVWNCSLPVLCDRAGVAVATRTCGRAGQRFMRTSADTSDARYLVTTAPLSGLRSDDTIYLPPALLQATSSGPSPNDRSVTSR